MTTKLELSDTEYKNLLDKKDYASLASYFRNAFTLTTPLSSIRSRALTRYDLLDSRQQSELEKVKKSK